MDELSPETKLEDELKWAFCIENDFYVMYQTNELRHRPWDKCPTQKQETDVAHLTNKTQRPNALGFVKIVEEPTRPVCTLDETDHLSIDSAFKRRGSATHTAGLMSYWAHDKIRKFLMSRLRKQHRRADLHGINLQDLLEIDELIWEKMADMADQYDGIQACAETGCPLDWIVEEVLVDPDVTLAAGPRLGNPSGNRRSGAPVAKAKAKAAGRSASAKKARRQRAKTNRAKDKADAVAFRSGARPSGAGGSGGGGAIAPPPRPAGERRVNMPKALVGMNRLCKDGFSGKCYGFNTNDDSRRSEQCKSTPPGQKCEKGWHFCMLPACSDQPHSLKVQHS